MNRIVTLMLLSSLLLAVSGCRSALEPDACATETTRPSGDNSQVSLDWEGSYKGVLPCADCEGIQTEVTIAKDGKSLVRSTYLGKSDRVFVEEGSFSWDREGRTITISGKNGSISRYLVGENRLIMLDRQGNRITGQLADRYQLDKLDRPAHRPDASLVETRWKLVELNGKPVVPVPGGRQNVACMLLKSDGSRVEGSGGCNRFFGSCELKPGNRIRFSKLGSTMMACPGIEREAAFFRVLEAADGYALDGDTLQLHKARMVPLARFEAIRLK